MDRLDQGLNCFSFPQGSRRGSFGSLQGINCLCFAVELLLATLSLIDSDYSVLEPGLVISGETGIVFVFRYEKGSCRQGLGLGAGKWLCNDPLVCVHLDQ
jgi:hypothetical protein